MMDQADNLRRLVGTDQFRLSGLKPVGIHSVFPGAGKSLFVSQLGYYLGQMRKQRVFLIEEIKNALGFCGMPRFLGESPGLRAQIALLHGRLSYLPLYGEIERLHQVRGEAVLMDEFDYSFIEAESPVIGVDYAILLLRDDRESLLAFEDWMRANVHRVEALRGLGVVVGPVQDGSQGSEFYRQMNDVVTREGFRRIEYLGHLPLLKNAFRSLKKQETLLELEKGSRLNSCLALILKRMGHWRLKEDWSRAKTVFAPNRDVAIDSTMDR